MNAVDFLKHYLNKYNKQVALIIFIVFSGVLLSLLSPLIFSFIIDNVITRLPIKNNLVNSIVINIGGVEYLRDNLWLGFLLIVFISLFASVFNYLKSMTSSKISEKITQEIRNDLYTKLQYLPFEFFSENKSGELIQKCTSDVDQIRRFIDKQIIEIFHSISTVSLALIILVSINVKLAFYCTLSIPLLLIVAIWFFNKMQKIFLASDEAEGDLLNVFQENLMGIRVVKAFNREIYETKRFEKYNEAFSEKTFKVIKLLGYYYSLTDVLCSLQILVAILFGILFSQQGLITVGDFFVFLSYELIILWPVRALGRVIADMGKLFVSSKRLGAIIGAKSEDLDSGNEVDLNGDIVFKDVSFKFPDGQEHALKKINLVIPVNKTTAIMGSLGSGKSTLVHLLCRLYDVNEGKITINNYLINDISKRYLRRNIGMVLQEPFLFSKTIKDNIRISRPFANDSMVNKAASTASISDIIDTFDAGYETMVGERGVTLSGGQKQRIAIARVIINDVKILIFDDSLSAVDSDTDLRIRKALEEIASGLTTIIITNRCESAISADQIVILNDGEVAEVGTHCELVSAGGFYQNIYEIQKYHGGK